MAGRPVIEERVKHLEWRQRAVVQDNADIAVGHLLCTEQVFGTVAKQRASRARKTEKAAWVVKAMRVQR